MDFTMAKATQRRYRAHIAVYCIAVGCALVPGLSSAQSNATPAVSGDNVFLDHLSIRQSLKDKNTVNEPAFITLTKPDGQRAVNAAAVAASWFLSGEPKNPKFDIAPAMQFNQNSTPDARQNIFVGGVDVEAREGPNDASREFLFARFKGNVGYKRNGEKHTNGMTANGYMTYEKNRPGTDSSSDSSSIPIAKERLELTPQAGIEFDDVLSATDASTEGKTTRGVAALKVDLFPLAAPLRKRLIISADLAFRRDLQAVSDTDRTHPFAQFSVVVALDANNVFSVSVDRVIGEDPTQDFFGPDFTRVALKVQFSRPQKRALRRSRAARQGTTRPLPAHII